MRSFHWSTGASVFAGLLGAGVVDAALVVTRAPGAAPFAVAALAVGIYGAAGLGLGAGLGWAVGIIVGALPARLGSDPQAGHPPARAHLAGPRGAVGLAARGAAGPPG